MGCRLLKISPSILLYVLWPYTNSKVEVKWTFKVYNRTYAQTFSPTQISLVKIYLIKNKTPIKNWGFEIA